MIAFGDFKYNLLNHGISKQTGDFLNLMYSNFIEPCITEATRRRAGQRRSIVDNIFTNIFEKNLHGGYLIDKITDHLPNFLFIADFIDQQKNQKTRIRNI